MTVKNRQHGIIFRSRFLFLVVSLFFYIVVSPFLENFIGLKFLISIFLTMILLSAIYAVSLDSRQQQISMIIAIPLAIFIWVALFFKVPNSFYIINISGILFFIFISVAILSFIFKQTEITQEVIAAAVVVYLFLGICWAFAYSILEQIIPGSFDLGGIEVEKMRQTFSYYSYVTLTTLGYGDITPLTSRAAALSVSEALVGQLYLTVLVARIIGLHISQSLLKKDRK
jgi:voltage-gated potassium channel